MKKLTLVLKHKWYEMIESGIKTEEYREIKPYWITRLIERRYMADAHHPVEERITTDEAREICEEGLDGCWECLFLRDYDTVCFSCGYTRKRMTFQVDGISIGNGNPDWGAPTDKPVFIIKLGGKLDIQ